jgi:hypothetical protein
MTKWPQDNQAALIAFYGDPGKGQIEPQLVPVTPPFRMTYEGTPVNHLVFHKKAADALLAALTTVWNYYGHDQAKLDALGISKTAGTFNKRFIRGSDWKWSNHAYGAAIDINAEENGFNVAGNIPRVMVAAFKAQGARWGGDYSGRTDPMHFEFCDGGGSQRTFEEWLGFYGVTDKPATAMESPTKEPATPAPAAPPASLGDTPAIIAIANNSPISSYHWHDRGVAPAAYIQGMALTFAQTYSRFKAGHPAALEMAKANTRNDEHDALSWYNSNFAAIGMTNDVAGADTLRHLFVLLLGVGMRESSGQHCCGRDQSASNTSADTAEAGLFQTSYNAHSCNPNFDVVMDEFAAGKAIGYLGVFSRGVECSNANWSSYGSGRGKDFQDLCKKAPAFAAESAAITLRNLRKHYGTVNRKEAEVLKEADDMFGAVQDHIDGEAVA